MKFVETWKEILIPDSSLLPNPAFSSLCYLIVYILAKHNFEAFSTLCHLVVFWPNTVFNILATQNLPAQPTYQKNKTFVQRSMILYKNCMKMFLNVVFVLIKPLSNQEPNFERSTVFRTKTEEQSWSNKSFMNREKYVNFFNFSNKASKLSYLLKSILLRKLQ